MNFLPVSLDAALDSLMVAAVLFTLVVVGLFSLGGVIVIVNLLLPSIRKRLALVEAELQKSRRQHRTDPLWWTDDDTKREPAFKQGDLYDQDYQDQDELPF
jgi:hypothetical protein